MGTLPNRLLRRELDASSRYSGVKGIYGDKAWISDLDIVNELGGHTGCVNALRYGMHQRLSLGMLPSRMLIIYRSWSKSGRLLASGSDDLHLNIHSYQPESSTAPFTHTTTIDTGHRANIFSVKFMPHSNDRTLVSCAGDAEVRVFDIEYTGQADTSSVYGARAASHASRTQRDKPVDLQYRSESNTNAKVFRSHGDRAKRIVTESSPFLFLSCSEDGEVRQWDIRQPSTAYPPPPGRHNGARRFPRDSKFMPPPLISYRRFHLELNTISCSASQPHYIALGGAHLHCLLHDRRMIGRNIYAERGMPGFAKAASSASRHDEEVMNQATRCVRRFAPRGQKKMGAGDNGHITSCKISDANPNEMVVSWSGDHIYSFDLAQSPDVRDGPEGAEKSNTVDFQKNKLRDSKERKRKRWAEQSSISLEGAQRATSAPRHSVSPPNGEYIPFRPNQSDSQNQEARDTPQSSSSRSNPANVPTIGLPASGMERRARWVAKRLARIRKQTFLRPEDIRRTDNGTYSSDLVEHFESVWKLADECLEKMDSIKCGWRYPVDPSIVDIEIQRELRNQRDITVRFMQATSLIAWACTGFRRKNENDDEIITELLQSMSHLTVHGPDDDVHDFFAWDFIKAIVLWLRGGTKALLAGFKKSTVPGHSSVRYPIPSDADEDGIREHLIPYLTTIADGQKPIVNVDTSRFERDETRNLFSDEKRAVSYFLAAVETFRAEELKGHATSPACASSAIFDGVDQVHYWALQVGRGILLNGGLGVTRAFVERCFGGFGHDLPVDEGRAQGVVDLDSENDESHEDGVIYVYENGEMTFERNGNVVPINRVESESATPSAHDVLTPSRSATVENDDAGDTYPMEDLDDSMPELEDPEDYADVELERNLSDDYQSDEESDAEPDFSNMSKAAMRERVEMHVPCSGPVRSYKGHCNVRTVKDVNFFGLQDEYVVSGSDSGHVFIWDKKTTELVNILEGDGEVVNVIQGMILPITDNHIQHL